MAHDGRLAASSIQRARSMDVRPIYIIFQIRTINGDPTTVLQPLDDARPVGALPNMVNPSSVMDMGRRGHLTQMIDLGLGSWSASGRSGNRPEFIRSQDTVHNTLLRPPRNVRGPYVAAGHRNGTHELHIPYIGAWLTGRMRKLQPITSLDRWSSPKSLA